MFYKVVRHHDDKLVPAVSSALYLERLLEYKLNEWTKPIIPLSKLFVFDHHETALHFLQQHICHKFTYKLFKCEAENPKEIMRTCFWEKDVEKFWEEYSDGYSTVYTYHAPRGSFVADRVKLIEEIKQ